MYSLDQELAFATQKVREQRAVIATLQSELAAAKESRDRESVAYDKLNAAYIDLNLELSKLRTTEYEYLLGEKDAQIDALRAKSTELKTSPLYACACEQFYDGKHHPECPARRQWEELQSDLAAAREELSRAREALIDEWATRRRCFPGEEEFALGPDSAEARYAREIAQAHKGEEGKLDDQVLAKIAYLSAIASNATSWVNMTTAEANRSLQAQGEWNCDYSAQAGAYQADFDAAMAELRSIALAAPAVAGRSRE